MIRTLAAVLTTDRLRIVLSAAAIALAFKVLSQVAEERTEHLAELESAIDDRRADLAGLDAAVVARAEASRAKVPYPSPEDLDPLGRGED